MASHSIVNTRAVDDLVIDEDDQFLPKTKTSRSSTPSTSSSNTPSTSISASDTDEEPAGLVKDTIIKGMCMCLFSGAADLGKLNLKKIREIDFTSFFLFSGSHSFVLIKCPDQDIFQNVVSLVSTSPKLNQKVPPALVIFVTLFLHVLYRILVF